ncbi:MAG: TVP38/TMEM64 family protein [Alphaproteobacteria bacterium]
MKKLKPYLRGLILIATFVAVGYLVQATGLRGLFDESWVDSRIRGQGVAGELLYLAVGAGLTAIGFPRQAVCFLAGYAFGFALGMPLALAASLGGCVLAFYYARLLGRSFVLARFPARIKRIDDFLHDNPLSMTLLLRLLPVGSNLVANLAAGVSGVRALPFFAGSVLGYVPQTVIFVLLGSGIHLDTAWTTGVSVALFVASSALGVYLFRRYRKSRALDDDVAQALDDSDSLDDEAKR